MIRNCLLTAWLLFGFYFLTVSAQPFPNPQARWIGAIARADARMPTGRTYRDYKISRADSVRWANVVPLANRSIRIRKQIQIAKPLQSALIHLSGLGHYELQVDSRKQGTAVLQPAWSDYDKRIYYDTYDLTLALQKAGMHSLEVWLGNGFYNVQASTYNKLWVAFGPPKLIATIQLIFKDGTTQTIASDASWQYALSPVTMNALMAGEYYDARLEENPDWQPVVLTETPPGRLEMTVSPPIREQQRLKPVQVTQPKAGVFVYDFGQNFAGYPDLTISGQPGQEIRLTPAELLHPDGTVNQRSATAGRGFYQLRYVLKGGPSERWKPRFTYFGSRFWQVEGARPASVEGDSHEAVISQMDGVFIHADAPKVGHFACSDTLFNAIHRIINVAFRSNMMHVMTDCPHREKLGWMEQDYLNGPALFYNYNVGSLYAKILNDMQDAQTPEGLIPDIAPEYTTFLKGFRDSPEWGSSYIHCAWLLYEWSGDKAVFRPHYDGMKRYLTYLRAKSQQHILSYGLGDWYDIGPGRPGVSKLTSLGVTATASYYRCATTMQQIAALLDKPVDSQYFGQLADSIRAAYNRTFFKADSVYYDRNSQTANAISIVTGLADNKHHGPLIEQIVADIRRRGNHVSAGDIGHKYLIEALQRAGRSDVLYDVTSRTDAPSYGAQIKNGATSLTEAWDANPLQSQNHFMLGQIDEWFYKSVAGLDFDRSVNLNAMPGKPRIVFSPHPVGNLTWAEASYKLPAGTAQIRWQRAGNLLTCQLTVPKGTSASIRLPTPSAKLVSLNGKRAKTASPNSLLKAGQYSIQISL